MSESSRHPRAEELISKLETLLNTDTRDALAKAVQVGCQHRTTIVLGSGASCGFGLPSMSALAKAVADMPEKEQDQKLTLLADNLSRVGANLEEEINKADLSPENMEKIRREVWECVISGQQKFIARHFFAAEPYGFSLARIFRAFLYSSNPSLNVVTTNYDQLAELAADACGADCITGFKGELVSSTFRRDAFSASLRTRQRTVRVLKVHGSLNWFEIVDDRDHSIFAVKNMWQHPAEMLAELKRKAVEDRLKAQKYSGQAAVSAASTSADDKGRVVVRPLIIPPSFRKYEEAFYEPYRSLIGFADDAFRSSDTVLCLGYGFNDSHIQEDLKASVLDGRTQLIAASMDLTPNCLKLIEQPYRRPERYLLLERLPLHVIFNYYGDKTDDHENSLNCSHLPTEKGYWSLDEQFLTKLMPFMLDKPGEVHAKVQTAADYDREIALNEERLKAFFTASSSANLYDNWKSRLRSRLIDSEEELFRRLIHKDPSDDQEKLQRFKQGLDNNFENLCDIFLIELVLDVIALDEDLSKQAFAAPAVVEQQITKEAGRNEAFKPVPSATAASAPVSMHGSAQPELKGRLSARDRRILLRDEFTFIHSSDPALDGRIVYGRFWDVDGLAKFFS